MPKITRAILPVLASLLLVGASLRPAAAETVMVRDEPSMVGVVAKDALWGGLLGAAVGGGILLIRSQGDTEDLNWERTMAISTGGGLLLGALLGIFDAASQTSTSRSVQREAVEEDHDHTTVVTPADSIDPLRGLRTLERLTSHQALFRPPAAELIMLPALRW